jgi:hypothetical protein
VPVLKVEVCVKKSWEGKTGDEQIDVYLGIGIATTAA